MFTSSFAMTAVELGLLVGKQCELRHLLYCWHVAFAQDIGQIFPHNHYITPDEFIV